LWQEDGTGTVPGEWHDRIRMASPDTNNQLGRSLAVYDDGDQTWLIAGMRESSTDKVQIYQWIDNGWTLRNTLAASGDGDDFGVPFSDSSGFHTVAITSDTAAVGAHNADHNGKTGAGEVYIYRRTLTTWAEEQRIEADDPDDADYFGVEVALAGDTLVVGAPGEGAEGAVYVFTRSGTTWSQHSKLKIAVPEAAEDFGRSVDISEDETTLIGGCPDYGGGGTSRGRAAIWDLSGGTWSETQIIQPANAGDWDDYGISVGISNDWVIMGMDNPDAELSVWQNQSGTWTETQQLTHASDDQLAQSCAIDGDTIVFGSHLNGDVANDSGAVHVYRLNGDTWESAADYYQTWNGEDDADAEDHLGLTVSCSGDVVAGGARDDDYSGEATVGSVYTWRVGDSDFGDWSRRGRACMSLAKERAQEIKPSEGLGGLSAMTFELDDIQE
jgi:hypothetical protein